MREGVVKMSLKCVRTNVKSMGAYACGKGRRGLEIAFLAYVLNECRFLKIFMNFPIFFIATNHLKDFFLLI
jgi:hypothetical protein